MKSIIFNNEMVKAILDGRKTLFRLPIKKEKICEDWIMQRQSFKDTVSKYKVDDILYVKETFALVNGGQYIFKADDNKKKYESVDLNIKWNSAVHLTQIEARIFLKVTAARLERLQDITFGSIEKEGYPHEVLLHHRILKHKAISAENKHEEDILNWWINKWNSTAKDGYKYEDNQSIFVYEFKTIKKLNI